MRKVPVEVSPEVEAAASPVAASVDRLLDRAPARTWVAEVVTVEPHRFRPGLWTAEAWLTNGAYLSLLGRSEEDVRQQLEQALERLGR